MTPAKWLVGAGFACFALLPISAAAQQHSDYKPPSVYAPGPNVGGPSSTVMRCQPFDEDCADEVRERQARRADRQVQRELAERERMNRDNAAWAAAIQNDPYWPSHPATPPGYQGGYAAAPGYGPVLPNYGGGQQPYGAGSFVPSGQGGFMPQGAVPSLTRDGQMVAAIAQSCGGEPQCMAARWAAVEVSRCAGGIGQPGGCLGPNGEIMRYSPQAQWHARNAEIAQRERTAAGQALAAGTGVSVDAIQQHGWRGGPNSVVNQVCGWFGC